MDFYSSVAITLCLSVGLNAQVLQCPSCTYANTAADIPSAVRSVIDTILNVFQEPKCSERLKGPIPEIKMETCAPPSGKVAMCSYYDGTVDVKIDLLVTFNIPMKVYQQGCYYALSANPPSVGCHNRKNINEDKSTFKRILESASSVVDDVVSFDGQLCVCRDSYCRDVSGAKQRAVSIIVMTVALLFTCLIMLL